MDHRHQYRSSSRPYLTTLSIYCSSRHTILVWSKASYKALSRVFTVVRFPSCLPIATRSRPDRAPNRAHLPVKAPRRAPNRAHSPSKVALYSNTIALFVYCSSRHIILAWGKASCKALSRASTVVRFPSCLPIATRSPPDRAPSRAHLTVEIPLASCAFSDFKPAHT